MKIGIVGAGFTGLSAAYRLLQAGHEVTVIEKDENPGGLAIGYKEKEWDWTLEEHYHHWFTNDASILGLARDIQFPVIIKRPHTNWYIDGKIYEFDSVKAALSLQLLSPLDRLRTLAVLGFFKLDPFWQPLERVNATTTLSKMMGTKAYQLLWEPLFVNKFGGYAKDISLAWFWARIKKRTQSLAYPEGGFLHFATILSQHIQKNGGKLFLHQPIINIEEKSMVEVQTANHTFTFDKVIVTLPSFLFTKLTPQLPSDYKERLGKLRGLGASNLVLRLKKPFFPDNTYWLSMADAKAPITAIVEHTNFMDKIHYHNEHLVYVGNYLSPESENFKKTKEELLDLYDPYLTRINPFYRKTIIGYNVFKAPFAQPIIPMNYSTMIPPLQTPLPHVYLANMQQVYPWDRGTNYAVELGERVATLVAGSK